jgi:hypothetical protein
MHWHRGRATSLHVEADVFRAIFELRSRRLRNYHFIYWLALITLRFVLDFPAPINIRVGSL